MTNKNYLHSAGLANVCWPSIRNRLPFQKLHNVPINRPTNCFKRSVFNVLEITELACPLTIQQLPSGMSWNQSAFGLVWGLFFREKCDFLEAVLLGSIGTWVIAKCPKCLHECF